ncbi:hypothetical protein RF11_12995 [Thelohanellus kitauei]|uniref:Kelch domain-containing protein 10 n=1 Tax=Thelohanellus kitauei TaxID=669202 RepID=A0A0C2JZ07_THEKT|nr:hypothetical protein RF11_12995 [Thelohanellus kitauei]
MSGGMNRWRTRCSDIWRLDFDTMEWFKLKYTLEPGIDGHRMSVVDDTYLYSAGGWVNKYLNLNKMERFILRPPSLYQLCLESVCRSPNITSYIHSLPTLILDELNIPDNDSSANVEDK